jgi:hypothetical protein
MLPMRNPGQGEDGDEDQGPAWRARRDAAARHGCGTASASAGARSDRRLHDRREAGISTTVALDAHQPRNRPRQMPDAAEREHQHEPGAEPSYTAEDRFGADRTIGPHQQRKADVRTTTAVPARGAGGAMGAQSVQETLHICRRVDGIRQARRRSRARCRSPNAAAFG